jgi:hypothetical protein
VTKVVKQAANTSLPDERTVPGPVMTDTHSTSAERSLSADLWFQLWWWRPSALVDSRRPVSPD